MTARSALSAIAPDNAPRAGLPARLWLLLRIAVPLVLLGYLLASVSLDEVVSGLSAVSLATVLVMVALMTFNLFLAALRSRQTLAACGITRAASLFDLFWLHWVGAFYNACVPGGVGGEVVRAVGTRGLFGERGFPGALGVALLERVLGVCGLLVLVTTAFTIWPLPGVPNAHLWRTVGVVAVIASIGGVLIAPRLASAMPVSLPGIVKAIPVVVSLPRFGLCLLMSVGTQLVGAVIGHLVIADISARVTLAQSLVIMPMIFASAFFPLTVGGAGVRELAFVTLYGSVGVPRHDALVASFVLMAVQFMSGAGGGIVQMLRPLDVRQLDRA